MSATEYADAPEPRSSVKLVRNASGACQIEVKAVAGEEPGLLAEAQGRAQRVYDQLCQTYRAPEPRGSRA